jgi:5-methylcytosine-specific restriction endonuclease McrA
MVKSVSLYNLSYQKLIEIDWKHAVVLLLKGKVSPCTEEEFVDIKTTSGIFKLPLHIILKKYVHIPYKELSPSRKNLFKRDDNTCQYCSCKLDTTNATIDHVLPRCRGGKHEWNNIVACCLRCNRKKGDRTPQEANMVLLNQPKPLKFGYFV